MKITWKDGISTLSAAGALVLERAYFHNYDWPLASSVRWMLGGVVLLGLISLVAGFAFDKYSNEYWDIVGIVAFVALGSITVLGMVYAVSDYLIAGMLTTSAIWLVSTTHHLIEHDRPAGTHMLHGSSA